MIRVFVLTSSRYGTASLCLPELCASPAIEVTRVILSLGELDGPSRRRLLKRKLKKMQKIGLLGALNGIRMRSWERHGQSADIEAEAERLGVPLFHTPSLNCASTVKLVREANADVGVSLGNSYISSRVFSIPRFGMINAHGERLPEYQNASSVIWPIYNMETQTGLTIHEIDGAIDTGRILYKEVFDIEFHPALRDTVINTTAETTRRAPTAVRYVCENLQRLRETARLQGNGRSYTTPTIWQFVRMLRNNATLFKKSKARSRTCKAPLPPDREQTPGSPWCR